MIKKIFHQLKVIARAPYTILRLLIWLRDYQAEIESKLDVISLHNHPALDSFAEISKAYAKKRTVIFVGRNYFGDNIKYAYLAFQQWAREHNVSCYFLTEDINQHHLLTQSNLPCLPFEIDNWQAEQIRILLETAVVVACDHFNARQFRHALPFALLKGAKQIQLWHGVSIKELGLQNLSSAKEYMRKDSDRADILKSCILDTLITANEESRSDWQRWFSFANFAPIGYPRNDVFFRPLSPHDLLNIDTKSYSEIQLMKNEDRPIILYTPTFRDSSEASWFKQAGIVEFSKFCLQQGYFLLVNLHPFEQRFIPHFQKLYPQINFVKPHTDIYPLAKNADILITDYSSLAFDYLHLNRPLIFYRPDHEAYLEKSRALIPEHINYMPGYVTHTLDELLSATVAAVQDRKNISTDSFENARTTLRAKLFDHHDGNSTGRFIELVESHFASLA